MKNDQIAEAYSNIYKKKSAVLEEGQKASGNVSTGTSMDSNNVLDKASKGKEGYKGASDIKNTGAGEADEAPDEQSPAKKRKGNVKIKETAKMLEHSTFEELYSATINEEEIPGIESDAYAEEEGDFPAGDEGMEEASPEETLQQIAGLVKELYDALSPYMDDVEDDGFEDDGMGDDMGDDMGEDDLAYGEAVSQPEPRNFPTNPASEAKRKLAHGKGPHKASGKANTGSTEKRDGSLQSGKGKVATGPSGNPLKHPANSVAGKASGNRSALEEV